MRLALAQHNAQIYGGADRIESILTHCNRLQAHST